MRNRAAGTYDLIAGRSLDRLAALSDGIFAVAMTLLVLDLRVPAREAHGSETALWHALTGLGPQFLTYFMKTLRCTSGASSATSSSTPSASPSASSTRT